MTAGKIVYEETAVNVQQCIDLWADLSGTVVCDCRTRMQIQFLRQALLLQPGESAVQGRCW